MDSICDQPFSSESQLPYLPDIGVLGLVPDQWDSNWQTRHQVMSRLARYFHVVWINPAEEWRALCYGGQPRRKRLQLEANILPGFVLYEPEWWLPRLYRPSLIGEMMEKTRLEHAKKILEKRGCKNIVLYLWRPEFAHAQDLVSYDLSCYHIDDEYSFSREEVSLDPVEGDLIKRSDQVFIHSPALLEKKGRINPYTLFVPNGVDYSKYAMAQREPDDLKDIPRPRIGYVGVVKSQLNWELIAGLLEQRPEWSFVFVGPLRPTPSCEKQMVRVRNMPNGYFLGAKPVEMLPAYTQHFDVCMMCYAVNEYTKYIYPLKLHEYLASGRPVVSTPIQTVSQFSHVVKLAKDCGEWISAIEGLLKPSESSSQMRDLRRGVARQYDWNVLVWRIAQAMCERLGSSYAERMRDLEPTQEIG